jgi:predicted phosphoadenosine phosphosulfate sulfurtransferase
VSEEYIQDPLPGMEQQMIQSPQSIDEIRDRIILPPWQFVYREEKEIVEVDVHRWYATVTKGGKVIAVIGSRSGEGLCRYDSVEEWEASL